MITEDGAAGHRPDRDFILFGEKKRTGSFQLGVQTDGNDAHHLECLESEIVLGYLFKRGPYWRDTCMILGAVQPFRAPKAEAPIFVLKDTFSIGGCSFLQPGSIWVLKHKPEQDFYGDFRLSELKLFSPPAPLFSEACSPASMQIALPCPLL